MKYDNTSHYHAIRLRTKQERKLKEMACCLNSTNSAGRKTKMRSYYTLVVVVDPTISNAP